MSRQNHAYSFTDMPSGKHATRKLAQWRFQKVDYTDVLQEYLNSIGKDPDDYDVSEVGY